MQYAIANQWVPFAGCLHGRPSWPPARPCENRGECEIMNCISLKRWVDDAVTAQRDVGWKKKYKKGVGETGMRKRSDASNYPVCGTKLYICSRKEISHLPQRWHLTPPTRREIRGNGNFNLWALRVTWCMQRIILNTRWDILSLSWVYRLSPHYNNKNIRYKKPLTHASAVSHRSWGYHPIPKPKQSKRTKCMPCSKKTKKDTNIESNKHSKAQTFAAKSNPSTETYITQTANGKNEKTKTKTKQKKPLQYQSSVLAK